MWPSHSFSKKDGILPTTAKSDPMVRRQRINRRVIIMRLSRRRAAQASDLLSGPFHPSTLSGPCQWGDKFRASSQMTL
jgi:hypothetical protein